MAYIIGQTIFSSIAYLPWVALLALAAWIVHTRFIHPLASIPGPYIASLTRVWLVWQVKQGSVDKVNRRLHEEYGPVVRIAPNEVSVSDPDAVHILYSIKSKATKTNFYPPWKPDAFATKHADQFTDLDEAHHSTRRRLLNSVYSMSSVLEIEEYVDTVTEAFFEKLSEYAKFKKPVDLGLWLQMYTFDVLGELFFGGAFGFISNGIDHENWIATLDKLMPVIVNVAMLPNMLRPFYLVYSLFYPSVGKALKALSGIAENAKLQVNKRQAAMDAGDETLSGRRDILSKLFELSKQKGEKEDFKVADIQLEAHVALVAGSDTTAIAMRAIIYQLLTHQAAMDTLMAELQDALKTDKLHLPVKFSEAQALPYFSACVKEAMRLHPSVGLSLQRHPPPGGCEIAGKYFPSPSTFGSDVRVGINAAVLHYDKTVFGKDADNFRPERWLEDGASNMDRYLLTFGGGTRTCIGKNISLSEIHKMLPHLLLKFKLGLVEPEKPLVTKNWWFHKQEGLVVKVYER